MARQQKYGQATKKLQTGNQLQAARALLGWSQEQLARASGTHPNTILGMERHQDATLTNSVRIISKVQEALEGAGIELLPREESKGVGVRLIGEDDTQLPKPTA